MMNRRVLGIPLPIVIITGVVLLLVLVFVGWALTNWGSVLDAGGDVLELIFRPNDRDINPIECADSEGCQIVHPIVYTAVFLLVVITGFAYTTLLERKLIAWLQQRVGPNRVGPSGFLQPAADGVKLIFKEDVRPSQLSSGPVYYLAPMIKTIPILVVMAVIPLGPSINVPWFGGDWYRVPLHLMDVNVGILWILGIISLGTYGVVLAGWASNNKYSMLGGLRATAQMISYELSMGITLAVPVLIAGSMSIVDIVQAQDGFLFPNWFIFQNPLAAGILFIALLAETNRAPFDLPEAEQELTAGYQTEYSGMKFALFMMAEYLGMIAVSMIAVSTFLGGYQDGFGLVTMIPILGPLVVIGKVVLVLVGMIWVRATLPRIRYDRLMQFGWKVLLPLGFVSVVWTAVALVVGDELGTSGYTQVSGILIILFGLGAGLYLYTTGTDSADEDDFEDDPMITGERGGLGYLILQAVGSLIAIPFGLFNFTITALEGIANYLPEEDDSDSDGGAPALDDGTETEALPAQSGGD